MHRGSFVRFRKTTSQHNAPFLSWALVVLPVPLSMHSPPTHMKSSSAIEVPIAPMPLSMMHNNTLPNNTFDFALILQIYRFPMMPSLYSAPLLENTVRCLPIHSYILR